MQIYQTHRWFEYLERRADVKHKNIRRECEDLWAKNKYYVLSKSHKEYIEIREYLKEKEVDLIYLNEKIQQVSEMEESKKTLVMLFFMYGDTSKKRQAKLKNKNFLTYWKNIWMGKIVRNL